MHLYILKNQQEQGSAISPGASYDVQGKDQPTFFVLAKSTRDGQGMNNPVRAQFRFFLERYSEMET